MKTHRRFLAASLALASAFAAVPASLARADEAPAAAQSQVGTLERGYRTGYSDGYQAGWSDQLKRAPADEVHPEQPVQAQGSASKGGSLCTEG